jgi:hypothetical protein
MWTVLISGFWALSLVRWLLVRRRPGVGFMIRPRALCPRVCPAAVEHEVTHPNKGQCKDPRAPREEYMYGGSRRL